MAILLTALAGIAAATTAVVTRINCARCHPFVIDGGGAE